jgi:hypothetical protein
VADTLLDRLLAGQKRFLHAGKPSRRAFAKHLHEQWPRLIVSTPAPPHGTLTEYMNRLARGEVAWWRSHPELRAFLLEELGEGAEALLPPEADDAQLWRFEGFAELPPLDLMQEVPPALGVPNLFELPTSTTGTWVAIPSGFGRTLAARSLAVRFPELVRMRALRSLSDAASLAPPSDGWLILDVEAMNPGDEQAAPHILEHRRVLIFAPGPLSPAALRESRRPRRREFLPLGHDEPPPRVQQVVWQAHPDWMHILSRWIAARVRGPTFEVEVLVDHLQRLDPKGTWLRTPADVMPLLALAHQQSELVLTGDRVAELAEELLSYQLHRTLLGQEETVAAWLRAHAREALRGAIHRRVESLTLPLLGPLRAQAWAELLPEGHAGPLSEEDVRKQLESLVQGRGSKQRRLAEVQRVLTLPDRQVAAEYLTGAGLLRQRTAGLDLHPSWLVRQVALQRIRQAIGEEAVEVWGPWCVEAERRVLADSVLDELDNDGLRALIERVLAFPHPGADLGQAAAVEALFAAVGRRLAAPHSLPTAVLHELWRRQRDLLVQRYPEQKLPLPRTRPGPGDWSRRSNAFLADCWSWSLRVPAPLEEVAQEQQWLFPGWASPSWSESSVLSALEPPMEETNRKQWDPDFLRLLECVEEVLTHTHGDLPHAVPDLLAPTVLLRRALADEVDWVAFQSIEGGGWERREFLHLLDKQRVTKHAGIASALFRGGCRSAGPQGALERMERSLPGLHAVLPAEAIIAELASRTLSGVGELVLYLPEAAGEEVMVWLLGHVPDTVDVLLHGHEEFEALPPRVLLRLVREEHALAWRAARQIWHNAPAVAEEAALRAITALDTPFAQRMITEAPVRHVRRLLEALERELQGGPPPWLQLWLRRLVVAAPEHAARAYALGSTTRGGK